MCVCVNVDVHVCGVCVCVREMCVYFITDIWKPRPLNLDTCTMM